MNEDDENLEEIEEATAASWVGARTTNILLMANALGLDVQNAKELNKTLLHLELVELAAGRRAA